MGAYKAPGPDGILPLFYWHVVGESCINFVQRAIEMGAFPSDLNSTVITLIPKGPACLDSASITRSALT